MFHDGALSLQVLIIIYVAIFYRMFQLFPIKVLNIYNFQITSLLHKQENELAKTINGFHTLSKTLKGNKMNIPNKWTSQIVLIKVKFMIDEFIAWQFKINLTFKMMSRVKNIVRLLLMLVQYDKNKTA